MARHIAPDEFRCEAAVAQVMLWHKADPRCPKQASVAVGGKRLCGQHAAHECLHLAMKAGKAQKLPNPLSRRVGDAVRTVAP